ncbi:hypothetical protein ILUMI_02552 [Ignelater luminosus]|uniref:Uncharacterized protein n=1 Tax=Ignelater luminosus TaxID=2038154 RepID=A0A8K0GGD1_IGNLU|nr:hypothetical protein ILUMI_02552 [Ignelater luminosus]
MPSVYKRKPGRSGRLSQRKTEAEFKTSRATIKNKLKKRFLKKPRHSTIFINDEEKAFASYIVLSKFGFPIADDIEEANNSYVSETEQQPERKKGRYKRPAPPESLSEVDNYSIASSLESNESFGSLQK